MHRASLLYCNDETYHKASIVDTGLSLLTGILGQHSKDLREAQSAVQFDISQMKGELHKYPLMAMVLLASPKRYQECGVETTWPDMSTSPMCLAHPRVAMAQERADLLWHLVTNTTLQYLTRNMAIVAGYPKRFSLMLDGDA